MSHYVNMMKNGNLVYTDFLIESDKKVKKTWNYNPNNRMSAYYVVISAINEGANVKQVAQICNEWNITDEDAKVYAERMNMQVHETTTGYKIEWKSNGAKTVEKQSVLEAICSITGRYNQLFENLSQKLIEES